MGPLSVSVKVDDLLANIRKSVDSDIDSLSGGTPTQTRGTLMRGALREMRISLGTEAETRAATLKATNATFDFFHKTLGQKKAGVPMK